MNIQATETNILQNELLEKKSHFPLLDKEEVQKEVPNSYLYPESLQEIEKKEELQDVKKAAETGEDRSRQDKSDALYRESHVKMAKAIEAIRDIRQSVEQLESTLSDLRGTDEENNETGVSQSAVSSDDKRQSVVDRMHEDANEDTKEDQEKEAGIKRQERRADRNKKYQTSEREEKTLRYIEKKKQDDTIEKTREERMTERKEEEEERIAKREQSQKEAAEQFTKRYNDLREQANQYDDNDKVNTFMEKLQEKAREYEEELGGIGIHMEEDGTLTYAERVKEDENQVQKVGGREEMIDKMEEEMREAREQKEKFIPDTFLSYNDDKNYSLLAATGVLYNGTM